MAFYRFEDFKISCYCWIGFILFPSNHQKDHDGGGGSTQYDVYQVRY